MRLIILSIVIALSFFLKSNAQQEIKAGNGITVIVPSREKVKTSYFTFAGGYQIPSIVNVPMVPENAPDLVKESDMEVVIPGWFAQIGINKKTRSNFELGLLAGFYSNSVHVALDGQRSTSDWVYEESGNTDRFTEVFDEDVVRTSNVMTVKALIKYKYNIQNINLWIGLTGGTFSSAIDYSGSNGSNTYGTSHLTALGLSYLAGIDIIKKNNEGEDVFGITIFSDISSPMIYDKYISLFKPGWIYDNPSGNYSINPFRVGLSLNIY